MVTDKLWPVLAGLVAMLAGTIVIELVASSSAVNERVVLIEPQASIQIEGDDEGDSGEAPEASPSLDGDHTKARLLASRGMLDEALALYTKVAAAHPTSGRVLAEMGYWQLSAKKPAEAQQSLERALAITPDDPWATLKLGTARARQDDDAAAEKLYRRALELKPHYGAAQLALGDLLARTGHPDEAIALLAAAAKSGSNDDRAHVLVVLGRAYVAKKDRDNAARAFERAVEYAPSAVEIRLAIGRAWMSSGRDEDMQRAMVELDRAVELAPDVPQVFSALARAKEKKNDNAGAVADYERALRLDPAYGYARRRLIRLALDAHDNDRARLHADELLRTAPEDPEHHFLVGLVASRGGRADDARRHYQDAITRAKGNYPEAYFNLGILEKNNNNPAAAIEAYRKAIELRPGYQQAWNNLGLVYAAAKNKEEAEAAFKKALVINGKYATAWLNLGQLYRDLQRDADALEAFDKAIAARPGYPEARLDRAVVLGRLQRGKEALVAYRELVIDQPRYVVAWYNLGVALEDTGDTAGARDAYRTASEIDPDHLPSLRKLGDLAARVGDPSGAARAFEEVLDRAPDDRGTRLALAEEQRKSGNLTECAHQARAVLSTTPGDQRAVQLLRECGGN